MPHKPNPPPDDPAQAERFIAMAREIGAAETEKEADEAFKKVVLRKKGVHPKATAKE